MSFFGGTGQNAALKPVGPTASVPINNGLYGAVKAAKTNGTQPNTWGFHVTTPQSQPKTPAPAQGTQSGPGILESWFNQRANGTDPAYEYGMKRGGDEIDNRMAAAGSFNSGARNQQLSDFAANSNAQRMGQLDALAGGASGEHQNRLNSMFSQGNALAGGESGINSAYDLAAGKTQSDALSALLGYQTEKAGIDSKANQGLINNGFGLFSSIYGGKK